MTLNVLVLAAGQGKRLKSTLPKPLNKVAGLSLLEHVLAATVPLNPEKTAIIASEALQKATHLPHVSMILQQSPKGTAHAVLAAKDWLRSCKGDVLILCGDTPLIQTETLKKLQAAKAQEQASLAILGMKVSTSNQYGRLECNQDGSVRAIKEFKSLSKSEQLQEGPTLCNAGILLADATLLTELLPQVQEDPNTKEYYLTDLVFLCYKAGRKVTYSMASHTEVQGINTPSELSAVEKQFQHDLRKKAIENGARLLGEETIFLSHDTVLEPGVVVHPHVVFATGVRVQEHAEILSFSHLEGAHVAEGATIGPYARLRPGTFIDQNAKVGNFVELKNTHLGAKSKINHLSYVGDATVGQNTNIGAGVITCNYDGKTKHKTVIGNQCFIGSNAALVAPLTLADSVLVGAGSVITADIEENALALSRPEQKSFSNKGVKRKRG